MIYYILELTHNKLDPEAWQSTYKGKALWNTKLECRVMNDMFATGIKTIETEWARACTRKH